MSRLDDAPSWRRIGENMTLIHHIKTYHITHNQFELQQIKLHQIKTYQIVLNKFSLCSEKNNKGDVQ